MKNPEFIQSIKQSGVVAAVFNVFQGRFTTFAILFTVVGIRLAFMGKLDANYALFIAAIQSLIAVHSFKEDWHEQRMEQLKLDAAPKVAVAVVTSSTEVKDDSGCAKQPS
jgi:hypothetical protein